MFIVVAFKAIGFVVSFFQSRVQGVEGPFVGGFVWVSKWWVKGFEGGGSRVSAVRVSSSGSSIDG